MKILPRIFGVLLPVFLVYACNEADIPVVTTNSITDISTTTAVSGGVITDNGGGTIMARGVCWDTIDRPEIDNNMTVDTVESLSFSIQLTGLSPSTTYYVRAFATNIAGTGYGNLESFSTLGGVPSSTALDATNIQPHSATLNGTVSPNLLSTSVEFEYGTTTAYGKTVTALQNPVSGDSSSAVSADITGLSPGETYHFRIKAGNAAGSFFSSDMVFITSGQPPSAETGAVTALRLTTVTLNATVNPNYLSTNVLFEWGTSESYGNSAIPAESIIEGYNSASLSADVSGLTPGSAYHFRIKATNELGTAYGSDMIFKTFVVADADNNCYYSVTIGTQTWMQENLKTTHYRDGNVIPNVSDNTAWKNLSSPGFCWYNNDESNNKIIYGALYNWYTINTGKLCPAGWHVPSNGEWVTLTNYLGGEILAGDKLKESGSTHWGELNGGTNETGFTAIPGGIRSETGTFSSLGTAAQFWSTSQTLPSASYSTVLYNNSSSLTRAGNPHVCGFSVRCVKD